MEIVPALSTAEKELSVKDTVAPPPSSVAAVGGVPLSNPSQPATRRATARKRAGRRREESMDIAECVLRSGARRQYGATG
jgi:hypothetical protein